MRSSRHLIVLSTSLLTVAALTIVAVARPPDGPLSPNKTEYNVSGGTCKDANTADCVKCTTMVRNDGACGSGHRCFVSICSAAGQTVPFKTCAQTSNTNSICPVISGGNNATGCGSCNADPCGCTTGSPLEACTINAANCGTSVTPTSCSPATPVTGLKWNLCQ